MQNSTRRDFLKHSSLSAAGLLLTDPLTAAAPDRFDVVVVGGTPGGIAAAVTAARLGRSVALVEYHRHLGGMSASGLGKSDIEHRPLIQGLFAEFVGRVHQHYVDRFGPDSENVKLCKDGYYYEPAVAEAAFEKLIAEQKSITRMPYHQLAAARTEGGRVTAVTVKDRQSGETRTLQGKVFIDATYEGDLVAAAGAEFRLGREGREEFNEPHAGQIYVDWRNEQVVPGGSGKGDKWLQAYTYRLCLSSDPDNAHRLPEPPESYDRKRYLGYLDDVQSGRFGKDANATRVALSIAPIPNRKTDVNMNPRGLGFVFVGENEGYVEADWGRREQIAGHIRNLTLGLLWFLQNDKDVPTAHRELAGRYHLARDEFADNGHFPFQLYVREARRLVGAYTLTEADITNLREAPGARRHDDAVAVGEFPVDSFPVQKRQPGDTKVLEGYMCMLRSITRPYQIPYRIMVPRKLDGLLVPVAASTTHVAFSSIRLEPTWMALGQAAGTAAHVAIEQQVAERDVPVREVQALLRRQKQVLDLPEAPEKRAK
jgi:hypothetical protein